MHATRPPSGAAGSGYTLARDAPIPNTFRVPARAGVLARLQETAALPDLLHALDPACRERLFVLGAGSNVLFTRDVAGAVLQLATRGVDVVSDTSDGARIRVAAGENWDAFVRWSLAEGFAGLENLILIPGAVGAAPIQNIGAYGVELSEFVTSVEIWDRLGADFGTLSAAECAFAYRNSVFKRERERYVVTAVVLALPRARELRLDYRGVREELAAMGVHAPGHADVGRAVERLRLRKLPNPAEIGNAGSFFKNPVYPADASGQVKLSAAWLIEACGFKGFRDGDVGVSDRHALVLVNYGGATGARVWALAERIRAAVAAGFGVTLEPEPLVL